MVFLKNFQLFLQFVQNNLTFVVFTIYIVNSAQYVVVSDFRFSGFMQKTYILKMRPLHEAEKTEPCLVKKYDVKFTCFYTVRPLVACFFMDKMTILRN